MEQELYQMYDTDPWGSHASRGNVGVFSSINDALYSLIDDVDKLILIFKKENRLFIEAIYLNVKDGYGQIFDTDNSEDLKQLKRIIFFESIEKFRDGLGFLSVSEDEIPFDIDLVEDVEDVTDEMIEEYLNEENAVKFIKSNLEE